MIYFNEKSACLKKSVIKKVKMININHNHVINNTLR